MKKPARIKIRFFIRPSLQQGEFSNAVWGVVKADQNGWLNYCVSVGFTVKLTNLIKHMSLY